jgi:rod shape-determining protein MreD
VLSRVPLVYGTADLTLLAMIAWALQKRVDTAWHWGIVGGLMVSFVSALPTGVPLLGYLVTVGLTLMLRRRIWHAPVLAMFLAVFGGTLTTHFLNLIALRLVDNPIPWLQALELITLPSLLLNLLLALPAYVIFADLAKWLYPEGLEM